MQKFRSKPVEIEAIRIGDASYDEILTLDSVKPVIGFDGRLVYVEVHTLEGTMHGSIGDWLIRGTEGEYYPCKDSVFQRKYEPIEE